MKQEVGIAGKTVQGEEPLKTGEDHVVDTGLRCEKCKYNLTGLTVGRCPECGTTFEVDRHGVVPIYRFRPLPGILTVIIVMCQFKIVAGMTIPAYMIATKGMAAFDFDGDGLPIESILVGAVFILPLAVLSCLASVIGVFTTLRSRRFKPLLVLSAFEVLLGSLGPISGTWLVSGN